MIAYADKRRWKQTALHRLTIFLDNQLFAKLMPILEYIGAEQMAGFVTCRLAAISKCSQTARVSRRGPPSNLVGQTHVDLNETSS